LFVPSLISSVSSTTVPVWLFTLLTAVAPPAPILERIAALSSSEIDVADTKPLVTFVVSVTSALSSIPASFEASLVG
jgi:hypothetical protein